MKKAIFGIVISILLGVVTGCTSAARSPQEMEQAYKALIEKVQDSELSEQKLAKEYAGLFEEMVKADKAKAGEYAELLRKMTDNECEFTDEEVFEVAESYAIVFAEMAEGFDDFGLQDVVVQKEAFGKSSIGFEYFGEVRAYSVKAIEDGQKVEVTFYDARLSEAFLDKYPVGEEHTQKEVKFRVEYTADHGVIICISGVGVGVEEKEMTTVNRPEGMIEIIISAKGV